VHDKLLLEWNHTKLNLNYQLPPVCESLNANFEQWCLYSPFFYFLWTLISTVHYTHIYVYYIFASLSTGYVFLYYLYILWLRSLDLLVGCSISSTFKLTRKSFPFIKSMFNKLLHNALRLFVHGINIHTKESTDNKYINAWYILSIKYWLGNELLNIYDFSCNFYAS